MSRLLSTLALGLAAAFVLGCALAEPRPRASTAERIDPVTVSLSPTKDVTLVESTTGALANGRGSGLFIGRTVQPRDSRRRTLVAFDVAAKLPAGSTIASATLSLSLTHTRSKARTIELRRPLVSWNEGPSSTPGGRGAPSEAGDVTWLARSHPDKLWRKPGGDFGDSPVAVATTAPQGERTTWGPTEAMIADVQSWLDHPKQNRGWLLLGDEDEAGSAMHWASREHEDESKHPRLTLTYRPPT